MQARAEAFRTLCAQYGIAVTHQRQVLYEVMQAMPGHPSPEEVYVAVRQHLPAISLATVYKNIHLFVESGVLRQVSVHHGSQRVEIAERDHHHLVCSRCKKIQDFDAPQSELSPICCAPGMLPGGFLVERCSIDLIGLCAECQQSAGA